MTGTCGKIVRFRSSQVHPLYGQLPGYAQLIQGQRATQFPDTADTESEVGNGRIYIAHDRSEISIQHERSLLAVELDLDAIVREGDKGWTLDPVNSPAVRASGPPSTQSAEQRNTEPVVFSATLGAPGADLLVIFHAAGLLFGNAYLFAIVRCAAHARSAGIVLDMSGKKPQLTTSPIGGPSEYREEPRPIARPRSTPSRPQHPLIAALE